MRAVPWKVGVIYAVTFALVVVVHVVASVTS